jgi:UDP-glucose 4-epimerase
LLGATGPAGQVSGWTVNVGAGARTSLLDLVRLAEEITGRQIALEHRPPRAGDVRDSLAGLDRARQVLGYEPVVSLREGLMRTWEWTKSSAPGEVVSEAAG